MGLFDRLRGDSKPRVAVIGLDGVPYSLISNHPEVFKNLTAMADAGDGGTIDSIIPPEESACWASLTTGVNPGETGVYGFQDREIDSYETYVPMGRDVQATRVWTRAHERGQKATVMNVPVTFPPERDIQRMVSGFLAPGVEEAAYPDEIREYLTSIDYRVDMDATLGHDEDKTAFIENAHDTLDMRFEAFEHYLDQNDWGFFCGVFTTPDRLNHFLYRDYAQNGQYYDAFMDFYMTLDEYIGQVRDALDDEVTLVVVSDHGFATLDYEVNCNAWLRHSDWLDYETDDPETLSDVADDTRAYSLVPGRFYLNLDGREPRGGISEEEYQDVRKELIADLEAWTGPDDNPVVDRIKTKSEAFRGDHDEIAPDVIAIPNDGFDLKAGFNGTNEVFTTTERTGMHTFDDAALFVDHPNARVQDADLYDVVPTILTLLDIDYDRSTFDGATLVK
jgi:predicted AlkP superfamily phosphohydrolase/phosphomutase